MSVYSGFSTRKLETKYGNLTAELICLLARRVIATLNMGQLPDTEWSSKFDTIYRQMQLLESKKYHPPKFSPFCKEIHDFCIVPSRKQEIYFEPFSHPQIPKLSNLQKIRRSTPRETSANRLKLESTSPLRFTAHKKHKSYHKRSNRRYLSISHQIDSLKEKVLRNLFP